MRVLDNFSIHELEELLIDLLKQRVEGIISPGEYRARAIDIVDIYSKKLKEQKDNATDAYDRAMGVI